MSGLKKLKQKKVQNSTTYKKKRSCYFQPVDFSTPNVLITCFRFFKERRRTLDTHLSVPILSLGSILGWGGGGGLSAGDWWRLADRRLGRSPSVPRCGRASHHPSPLYTSTCHWAGNNSSERRQRGGRRQRMGAEEEGGSVCQTPVTLLFLAAAPLQLIHVAHV